ncbi:dithiol-disulfide isomerase [Thermoplasmatales archaeon SW_10_69_26]|nr:MAG: dithiol-disulfide isomerase [Thermoplasmatales archaeon SW_10_69_26]
MGLVMPDVEFFSDLHCPHAYLTRYRLRQINDEVPDDVSFRSRCLSIEYDKQAPTPKRILDVETHSLVLLEEQIPYEPWPDAEIAEWPSTFFPAFEAVKAAESIDPEMAWELDWRIRQAFFAEHACLTLRHVLADLAEDVGLARERFLEVYDDGHRAQVVAETEEGWYEEGFTHSPAIRLPDGSTHVNPGAHRTEMDPERNFRLTSFDPGREDEAEHLAELIEDAV